MQPQRAQLRKVMRETFGVKNLREGQEEVMQSVLKGQNTLAIMPTGAGKSLYFQLPALLMPGTTIVVSPLIALELNSSLPQAEQALNVKAAAGGKTDFLYVTPERLTKPTFLQSIRKMKIDLVVIDEAHCVSQWGHDFRPAYLALRDVLTTLGNPPVLALTATATEDVIEDIEKQLALKDLRVFKSGVLRDNLHYETVHVEKETDKPERLVELLKSTPGNGIIYCATIKMVEETTEFLKSRGLSVTRYHGKLPAKERHLNQDLFMQDKQKIHLCALK